MTALLLTLLFVASDPAAPAAPAVPSGGERACKPLGADEQLRVDFAEAPLADIARLVSCALEKNLLFQPASLGDKRVTVLGPRPIGRRDLEALWLALLADQDLVEERHGAFQVVRPVRK